MPAIKNLTLSTSVLVLLLSGTAWGAGPAAPQFGEIAAPALAPAPAPAAKPTIGVPAALAAAPAPVAAPAGQPVVPGVNPFAPSAPSAAPAPASASAAAPSSAFQPATAPQDEAAVAAGAPGAADPNKVDDAALRYYASTRDLERVGAEIRRLKTLHPDWQPPTDLFAKSEATDESDLWALFTRKDFPALDAALAARAKANPGWKPSADLAGKLEMEKARFEIGTAAGRSDWNGVVAASARYPNSFTCANMDLLWSLGEGYARLQNFSRAFDLYGYILKTCEDPNQRLSTYQKAAELLPPQGAEALAGLGRTLPSGQSEFAALQFDPLRREMGAVASGEATALPDPQKLRAFASSIAQTRNQGDAALFGWYLYAQKDFAGATEWFKAASALGPDPKAMEGYILSLRGGGREEEASALAFANRGRAPEFAKIYVELISARLTDNEASGVLDEPTLRAFTQAVEQSRSALGAQSLGWNLLAHEKVDEARAWFAKSVEWQPTKEGVTGLAVVAARSKNRSELREITAKFGDDFPELASLQVAAPTPVAASGPARPRKAQKNGGDGGGEKARGGGDSSLMAEANAAFKSRRYADAIAILDKRQNLYGRNGGAEVLRGWANLKLGRFDEARRVFKQENRRNSTKDTRFGIGAVSNQQYNMWN